MAADRFSCCQAPVELKWVQKVHGMFVVLLRCFPPQLYVTISAVVSFLQPQTHAMSDLRPFWDVPLAPAGQLALPGNPPSAGGLSLASQVLGKAGGCGGAKAILNEIWGRVKKRRRVKAGEGLWQPARVLFLFPVGISNNSGSVLVDTYTFCSHRLYGCSTKSFALESTGEHCCLEELAAYCC